MVRREYLFLISPIGPGADVEVFYWIGSFDRLNITFIPDHDEPQLIDVVIFTLPVQAGRLIQRQAEGSYLPLPKAKEHRSLIIRQAGHITADCRLVCIFGKTVAWGLDRSRSLAAARGEAGII